MHFQPKLRARTLELFEEYGILLSGVCIFLYYLWVAIDFFTNPHARRDFNGSFFQFSSVFMLWGMLFLGAKLYEYVKKQKQEEEKRKAVIHEYENRLLKLELLSEVSEQVNDAVNNPLAIISISASSIRKQFEPNSEMIQYLDSIEGALRRVKEVLSNFQSHQTTKIMRSIEDVSSRRNSSDSDKVLSVDPTGDIRPS